MKYSDFLQKERPCPFDNPKQEDVILENDLAYMTYALAPYQDHHLLVVPKRHVIHLLEVTKEEREAVHALEEIGHKMLHVLGHESVSFIVREGAGSGRTVSHLHYHLIPDVRLGDIDHKGDERRVLTPEEVAIAISVLGAAAKEVSPKL